jgi:site-specific DNA-methyltransferase (adenine-specific)
MINLMMGDCLERMKEIESGSVDAVICDPPYGTTACKWDSVIDLELMWEQLKRIVKPNGAIVLTASQPFTSVLIMSNLKSYKYNWVWHKKTAGNGSCAKFQPLKTHEDVVVFSGKYKPQMITGKNRMKGGKNVESGEASRSLPPKYHKSDQYYPKSVLNIKTERGFHPTQKPVALMEYLIKTYTNEGEIVLDFAMGSGSTIIAAKNTDRSAIGIEMDEGYFKIAQDRIKNHE